MALDGKNISLPIYHKVNGVQTPFHNLVLHKFTVDSVVMSLGDKITGDVYYIDKNLVCSMQEYVVFNDVEYTLVNPPTLVKEGMVSDNSDLKGMCKYSFEFYHPMYLLGNLPFTDVAVSYDELRYKSQDKTFSWIGKPADFVAKLNKNLDGTEWVVVLSDRFPLDKEDELSDVLSFDNNTIADVLKTGYETWGVPFVVDKLHPREYYFTDANHNNVDYYSQQGGSKRFVVVFGLPSNEIYESASANSPFVFQYGQGVGLKNHSRTPRNNKIVTRIAGYGSENNIPYGYPQVVWYGNQDWDYTINNAIGMQEITVNGQTITAMSYPIYKGIVGGRWVKLIKHPFTRNHLMPTIYADAVFNKVSQYALDENENVIDNPNYNPDLEIKDYYDAVNGGDYTYVNLINPVAPSYEIHEFEEIKPELGEEFIVGANPINADLTDADSWDDTMDDNGNYLQSYFKIVLPQLDFDIYACAAITQEMQINMRSGACIGCTFTVQVDWEDYKRNFYDSELNFLPNGSQRDLTRYPNSKNGSITVVVQKDNNTFGTLMPNIYQYPQAGDAFVVLGISLPLEYITNAQERLDDAMKSYMLENNLYYFDYPLKFDEYFLANNTYILNQIRPNSIIRFMFNDEEKELFVKQLTIKFNENTLPQYDITLTDNVEVVLNSIGQVADDVEHLGTLIALLRQQYNKNVWVELSRKLSRATDDSASGVITFLKGLVSSDNADFADATGFQSGWLTGRGARIDKNGNAEFESVRVRGSMTASELVFNLISAEEGESIRSIGHGEIKSVTMNQNGLEGSFTLKLEGSEISTVRTGDICRGMYNNIGRGYSTSDGEDVNGFRKQQGFFSSYFTITNIQIDIDQTTGTIVQKYIFSLQTQDKDGNAVVTPPPCVGMKFVAYGNTSNANRRSCMYISAVGQSPKLLFLTGVSNYWILPENIKIALGNINGTKVWEQVTQAEYEEYDGVDGVSKKTWFDTNSIQHWAILRTLTGDAGFYCEDNIYLGGIIEQFKSAALDAITSEIDFLGQARIICNYDTYPVDCNENGIITNDSTLELEATLWNGSDQLTITNHSATWKWQPLNGNVSNNTWGTSIDFDSGEEFSSGVVSIVLTGVDTHNNSFTATKTVSVIANKQGASVEGDDGRGIQSVVTYYKAFAVSSGVTVPSGDPTEDGWSASYVEPTEENPFLWRFTRTTYTDGEYDDTDAEFVGMWTDVVNPNLLDDTDFVDNNHLSAWYAKCVINPSESSHIDNSYTGYQTINRYSEMSHRQFLANVKMTDDTSTWCQILCQRLVTTSGVQRVEAGKWYTFSFWVLYYRTTKNSAHTPRVIVNVQDVCDGTNAAYKDGVQTTGYYHEFTLEDVNSQNQAQWFKHTITFKTNNSLSGELSIRIETKTMIDLQMFYICMPKLEIGKMATRYISKTVVSNPFPRTSNWEIGKQYYQGAQGEPYIDIVRNNGQWNRCRVTHVSDENNAPVADTITAFWEPSNDLSFISTDLILANTALIENLVARSLRTAESGSHIPHVEMNGNTVAFYGTLDTPSIELTTGAGGVGVLRFYNADGTLAYDLGPNSITQQYSSVDSIFRETYFKAISGANTVGSVISYSNGGHVIGISTNQCDKYHLFIEGYVSVGSSEHPAIEYNVSGVSSPSSFNQKYLDFGLYQINDDNVKSGNITIIEDGWYVMANSVEQSGIDYVTTKLHKITNGKIIRSITIMILDDGQTQQTYYDTDGKPHRYLNEVMNSTIPDLDRE